MVPLQIRPKIPARCLAISACLLGESVRYDGGHKHNPLLHKIMADHLQFLPFCPEVGCGLSVPRLPMRLLGQPDNPRLCTSPAEHGMNGVDHSQRLRNWCQQQRERFWVGGVDGFLFKSRSPSCGMTGVQVYPEEQPDRMSGNGDNRSKPGMGIFAQMMLVTFPHLPMAEGDLLTDEMAVRTFLQQVMVG